MSVCYITKYYGTELVATIGGAEITNPLLQTRWFLRESKNHKSWLGISIDIAFMVSFGLVRIGAGTVLLVRYYQQDTDFLGRLGGTIIYTIGWLFWIGIVQYAYKKWIGKGQKKGSAKKEEAQRTESNGIVQKGEIIRNGDDKNGVHIHKRNGVKKDLESCDEAVGNSSSN